MTFVPIRISRSSQCCFLSRDLQYLALDVPVKEPFSYLSFKILGFLIIVFFWNFASYIIQIQSDFFGIPNSKKSSWPLHEQSFTTSVIACQLIDPTNALAPFLLVVDLTHNLLALYRIFKGKSFAIFQYSFFLTMRKFFWCSPFSGTFLVYGDHGRIFVDLNTAN